MNKRHLLLLAIFALLVALVAALWPLYLDGSRSSDYQVLDKFPHDRTAYTQGLLVHNGVFYESTGLYGQSSLRKVEIDTGRVLQRYDLPRQYFGEGLALLNGVLIQLTWKAGKAFFYDSDSFELLRTVDYKGQGWGLTHDGKRLIMSDGSDKLTFRDPRSFAIRNTIRVRENGNPVRHLNELEYIDGVIWANVYQTDDIVLIDPKTGEVSQRLDFAGLVKPEDRYGGEDVLNGIAYDADREAYYVTGKRYSFTYEIEPGSGSDSG